MELSSSLEVPISEARLYIFILDLIAINLKSCSLLSKALNPKYVVVGMKEGDEEVSRIVFAFRWQDKSGILVDVHPGSKEDGSSRQILALPYMLLCLLRLCSAV